MIATVSRILLPTRFSMLSKKAAEYVRLLVPKLGAELHILHVVPHTEVILDPGMPGIALPIPGAPAEELLDDARRRIDEFAAEVVPDLADRTIKAARVGGVTDELIRYIHDERIDLVIMGTHADGMLKRVVFGSVGKGVLEGVPCPVMLVPVHNAPR